MMPGREKVIENLERMLSNYDMLDDIVINKNNEMLMFHRAVAKAALDLLKEQKEEIEQLNRFVNGFSRDAMPVVRCKDCRYWSDKQILKYRICKKWEKHCKNFATSKDWFCADGERKEDG